MKIIFKNAHSEGFTYCQINDKADNKGRKSSEKNKWKLR